MTEITKIKEENQRPRYSVNPTAFFAALLLAPLVVTLLSSWTLIGLFALPFGIIPYLAIGTPMLLWAVGRVKPSFGKYAGLGIVGNNVMIVVCILVALGPMGRGIESEAIIFLGLFGLIFAPLYAGTFGALYARFHKNIRILQPV